MSSICSVLRKTVAELSLSFSMSIRSGSGSLQVMMAGLGRRASTWNAGGSSSADLGVEDFLNSAFFCGWVWCAWNCRFRRAKVSSWRLGGRGGSIGRNLMATIFRLSKRVWKHRPQRHCHTDLMFSWKNLGRTKVALT